MSYADPASGVFAVTLSNTTKFTTNARAIYVGVGGDVSLLAADGTTAVFKSVPTGATLPVQTRRVNVTGTTATDIVGLL